MRSLIALFLLAFSCLPAAAQVYLGAELGPDAFIHGEEGGTDTLSEEAFAWALSVEVSSPVLYSVFGSTAPEEEMTKYLRQGIYRQEFAAILLLAVEKGLQFGQLAGELPKAGGFAGLAGRHKADAMALFAAGGRLKEAADLRVPLFLTGSNSPAAVFDSSPVAGAAPAKSTAPAAGQGTSP